ncbi:MAG: dihydroorotate dehydrogenase electron transfer subunit [Candidatus Omnitrophica bacterium]|nr:dihydroorotate dehydrogenase electron transfer subunit [Candidatus Omnitrophota bacterium]
MKPSKIFQTKAKLIKNVEIAPDYYKMVLNAPGVAKQAQPGQFVNIRVSDKYEPLLRRPFSIHRVRVPGHQNIRISEIEILYKVVGVGTKILSQKKPGDKLDVLGPLGNGFSILDARPSTSLPGLPITRARAGRTTLSLSNPSTFAQGSILSLIEGSKGRCSILVGGGIGVAPLVFLSERLVHSQQSTVNRKTIVLLGAKTKSQILCEKEFKDLGCEVRISTDDGSKGFRGKTTELLKELLWTKDYRLSTIYACGPKPMLKEIANISKRYKIPAQVSLEEHMACGIGACFGCVVETKDGYKRVCKDGPVFDACNIKF